MAISVFHFFVFLVLITKFGGGQDECKVSRCSGNGPAIRFPFWLKTIQPEHCGYPGFELSCNQKKQTVLELPSSVEVLVKRIHYKSQSILISDLKRCLPAQLPSLNLSASPFNFSEISSSFSFFNCSPPYRDLQYLVPCLRVGSYQVYAIADRPYFPFYQPISCVKIYDISSVPKNIFINEHQDNLQLAWLEPNCTKCEAQNKVCRSKKNNNASEVEVQCLDMPKTDKGAAKKLLVSGLVIGAFLAVLGAVAIYRVYISYKTHKEDQVKIVKFLEDYKALTPTRYSFADIKKITNNFKDKLGEGGFGTVFRGKLSREIIVAVKLLSSSVGNGEEFINEVGTMSRIHHVNVVRLVGFCADGTKRALVYDFLPNGSLEKFIFSENEKKNSLGWMTLQDIALGIARGIEYLHQGCDHQILHFDIKPHNVLLDQNFNPRISDFGLAKLCSKEQSIVSMSAARGTMGYIAPELFSRNFGNVSYKSDVYSFGMLLLEMVGGRKNIDTTVPNTSQTYFPEWVYNRSSRGEELGMRNIEEEEEHSQIAKKLAIVGLRCIRWYPVDRPSMKTVVQMLEGNGDTLTVPPNPFASTRPARAPNAELEVISESE